MNALRINKSKGQSGQVLVLGALCCLVLAVTVFSVLNVERRVHERIRLQNFADERAYSLAVQEARTFNYFAYSNRAVAAGLVAMANLHAYMTEAAMTADIDFAMFEIMMEIAAQELDDCFCYWGLPWCPWHCVHAAEAVINGAAYLIKWLGQAIAKNIQELDDKFKSSMQALGLHMTAIYYSQLALAAALGVLLLTSGDVGDIQTKSMGDPSIKDVSKGTFGTILGAANAYAFDQALNMGSGSQDKSRRAVEMTAVANGSRPGFTQDRGGIPGPPVIDNILLAPTKSTVEDQAPISSVSISWIGQSPAAGSLPWAGGRTGVTSGAFPGLIGGMVYDADNNTAGNSIASFDWGALTASFQCHSGGGQLPLLAMIGPGELISSSSTLQKPNESAQAAQQRQNAMNSANSQINGARGQVNSGDVRKHLSSSQQQQVNQSLNQAQSQLNSAGGGGSDTRHRVDLGINIDNPHKSVDHSKISPKTYEWIDFAYNNSKKDRPAVYAAYTTDTRFNDVSNKPSPWEINGGVKIDFSGAQGSLDFTKSSQATAVSKAMVYYHRLGYWQEGPNFFNPYWRAKLESIDDATEFAGLVFAGGVNGEAMADAAALYSKGSVNLK